jgi:hypothetical protein
MEIECHDNPIMGFGRFVWKSNCIYSLNQHHVIATKTANTVVIVAVMRRDSQPTHKPVIVASLVNIPKIYEADFFCKMHKYPLM